MGTNPIRLLKYRIILNQNSIVAATGRTRSIRIGNLEKDIKTYSLSYRTLAGEGISACFILYRISKASNSVTGSINI